MNYKYYTTEDFLKDEGFKDWALKPDPQKDIFWAEVIAAYPEKRQMIQEALGIIRSLHFEEYDGKEDYQKVFRNIITGKKSDTWEKMQKTEKPATERFLWIKVAASVSIIAVLTFLIVSPLQRQETVSKNISYIEKSNPDGRKTTFALSDGTIVTLNSNSRLSYPETFHSGKRAVELTGEAFFNVAENKNLPFVVVTGNTETTALGTSFNIRAWPEDERIDIALVTGKVVVNPKGIDHKGILLEPGEKVVHDVKSNEYFKTSFNLLEETGWREKVIYFKKASLEDFVNKLERWYGVSIRLEGRPQEDWSIDGEFRDVSLEEILSNLSYVNKTEYKIEGKIVTLKFQ